MKAWLALLIGAASLLQSPDAGDVRDALDRYLLDYEPQLSALIADEDMTQRVADRGWSPTYRRIQSEVAFVSLPGRGGWLGFRRVVKVNGKAIDDQGTPLAHLLGEASVDDLDQAKLLLDDSAAQNLGQPRTINLPNLPLDLLHPRNRHHFSQVVFAREKVRGAGTVVLRLEEFMTPTIIQQGDGGDMKTVILAWVEMPSGRLHRAEVRVRDIRIGVLPFDAVIRVDFKANAKLGLLVPAEMNEEFFVSRTGSGTGTAKYSNYRRFQTSGRIVPPPGH